MLASVSQARAWAAKSRRARKTRARRASRGIAPPAPTAGTGATARLGWKYTCFECEAKFYDLNRPEPLCPKCGADQRKRPATPAKSKPAAKKPKRKQDRAMAPLLDDDGESMLVERRPERPDLGIAVVDSPEDIQEEEDDDADEEADSK